VDLNTKRKSQNWERFSYVQVLSFSCKVWRSQPEIAKAMADEASSIIQAGLERKPTFFSGKSAKGVTAGLFYHLGFVRGCAKTQAEIAKSLETTDMTVRASSRDWLNNFLELFPTESRKYLSGHSSAT
jgi:transcription initiation factor TFIIIB Brf1 subunit/transcription initiation factor TFIIB